MLVASRDLLVAAVFTTAVGTMVPLLAWTLPVDLLMVLLAVLRIAVLAAASARVFLYLGLVFEVLNALAFLVGLHAWGLVGVVAAYGVSALFGIAVFTPVVARYGLRCFPLAVVGRFVAAVAGLGIAFFVPLSLAVRGAIVLSATHLGSFGAAGDPEGLFLTDAPRHPPRILILGAYGTGVPVCRADPGLPRAVVVEGVLPVVGSRRGPTIRRGLEALHEFPSVRMPPYVTARGLVGRLARSPVGHSLDLIEARRGVQDAIECRDLLVLGGGNRLTDGPTYFLEHFVGQITSRAHRAGKAIGMIGVGFGPGDFWAGPPFALERLAEWVRVAAFREEEGAEAFDATGFSGSLVTGDAVRLDPPTAGPAESDLPPRALVSLREPIGGGGLPVHVTHAVNLLQKGQELGGLAMHPELDRPVLAAELGESAIVVADTPLEIAASIARSTVVLGMRLHACIVAATLGIPVVPIAYHSKVKAFAEALGIPFEPLRGPVSKAELRATIDRALSNGGAELQARAWELRHLGVKRLAMSWKRLPFDAAASPLICGWLDNSATIWSTLPRVSS